MLSNSIASPTIVPFQETAGFLEALLRPATPDSFLEIRPLPDVKSRNRQWHRVGDLRNKGFEIALPVHLDGKANVYFGVCPRVRRGGTGEDVSQAVSVWFDEITRPAPNLPPFSWIVETSPGKVQGGYFLDRACHDLDRVERLAKRLAAYVGGDHVHNRDRILRLPGFVNVKYPEAPRSSMLEFHPDLRYTLEELERLIPIIEGDEDGDQPRQLHDGPFNPHQGKQLSPEVQQQLMAQIQEWGLRRHYDERYAGACHFPHDHGPSDVQAFYVSPLNGFWYCFRSSHQGRRYGGVGVLLPGINDLSWEEIEAAVGADPAVINYVQETNHDATASHEAFEGAGAGRRRFTGHRGPEIRQVQDRQGKIWLEAHRRLGDTDSITRANQCGGLYGRTCDEEHITADAGKERSNCKQRLHPRCMGTNARKAFYVPKTQGQTKIDDAGDMDINVLQLGRFDMGEDLFLWSPNIRRQLQFVRDHIGKLRRRQSTPLSFKDSFIGWRGDFRRGVLTVDLVIAGGRDADLPGWLKESFAEVASQPVRVETLNPRTPKEGVGDFGNLMSSAFAYSDVEECLAMLEALNGWHLVQGQGKFHKKTAAVGARCEKTSIEKPTQVPIEENSHPVFPPCPECGRTTRSAGFRTGRWEKGIGTWSKKPTWRLLNDNADPGGGPGEGYEDLQKDVAQAREERLASGAEVLLI